MADNSQPLKIEVGGIYRIKRTKVEVVCEWIEEETTNPRYAGRWAEFSYLKPTMQYEAVPIYIIESRWYDHLEPHEILAQA